MLKNMKLRTRLTLFMAIILLCACAVLTFTLIYSAGRIYQTKTAMPSPDGGIITEDARTKDFETSNDTFRLVSLISIAFVFVMGTGATYMMSGKALSPITKLSRSIETIDENNLFMPVCETASGDEVSRLSASFNNMIRKLEKAFIAQKNFSANAAHELKTPLTAMISRIEVCQLGDEPTALEYKDTLRDVLFSAERLTSLVNDLLEMNAQVTIEKREGIDVKQLFEYIIRDVSQNNIKEVHFDNQVDEINLYGDRQLLYRALLNIVQNAVKYNKPNGLIAISAAANKGSIVITVTDTGIGIPSEQLDKIFEPFYCVDKSRSRQLGGSGLGLALTKTIIEKHGGSIRAESDFGVQTTITITLPQ